MIETATLGPGYHCSRLIKGCWHLSGGHGTIDPAQAVRDMAEFVDAGLTTFDCADHYTGVEELIGRFRREHSSHAKRLQIHTKCVPDYDRLSTCDRSYLTAIIDRSLQRMGVECLDLVQFYWWNPAVPGMLDAMGVLADLRRAGKIAHLGITNFNTEHTRQMLQAGLPIAATQVQYSLLDDRPERGLTDLCREHGIQLLCYGTLAGGMLSEAWLAKPEPQGPFENRSHTKYKLIIEDAGGWAQFQMLLATLNGIARRHGCGIGDVATRWVLQQPQVAASILGFTSTRHLDGARRAGALQLTAQDLSDLAPALARRRGPPGDVYDVERDKTGKHGRIMRYNLNEGRH
jgi:aryl-alcohol dehydrogenase-like predicted oxidoreductase